MASVWEIVTSEREIVASVWEIAGACRRLLQLRLRLLASQSGVIEGMPRGQPPLRRLGGWLGLQVLGDWPRLQRLLHL